MAKGFWRGLITGGFLGAVFGSNLFMTPQKKRITAKRIAGKTRKFQNRAQKVIKEVSSGVTDLFEK